MDASVFADIDRHRNQGIAVPEREVPEAPVHEPPHPRADAHDHEYEHHEVEVVHRAERHHRHEVCVLDFDLEVPQVDKVQGEVHNYAGDSEEEHEDYEVVEVALCFYYVEV